MLPEPEEALVTGIKMYSIIQISAFMDEWNTQFLKLKDDNIESARIEKVERIVKPALDVINLYPDIRKFRNTLLAHNSRIEIRQGGVKKYINTFRGDFISTLVTPATISEFMLLGRACLEIAQAASTELAEFFIQPEDFMSAYTKPNTTVPRSNEECYAIETYMLAQMASLTAAEYA